MNKKSKKDSSLHLSSLKNVALNELQNEERILEEQERQALGNINQVERGFFLKFTSEIQEVMAKELEVFGQSINISKEALKLDSIIDRTGIPFSMDGLIDELVSSGQGFVFITPPPSPKASLMKSWGGSVMSLASILDSPPTFTRRKKVISMR